MKVYHDTNCCFNLDWDDVKNAFVACANWQKKHDMILSQQQITQISNTCKLIQNTINILNSDEHK